MCNITELTYSNDSIVFGETYEFFINMYGSSGNYTESNKIIKKSRN
jgi:hypothetical protein